MKRLIDIVTVTKDDFRGVSATIKSSEKLRQHDMIGQVIIDSSKQETCSRIEDLVNTQENIEYYWQPPSGIASAFNLGLNQSNSEWVWFLNGGDEVHPEVAPESLLYILNNSLADAIIFQIEMMQSGGTRIRPPLSGLWPPVFNWIPHPSTLTRRELYKKYGNFDESYTIAMDYDFWFRCFSKDTVVDTLSIKLTRHDETGLSHIQKSLVYKETLKIIKTYWLQMIKNWLFTGFNIYRAWRFFSKG